jgi:hypothetical protein
VSAGLPQFKVCVARLKRSLDLKKKKFFSIRGADYLANDDDVAAAALVIIDRSPAAAVYVCGRAGLSLSLF